MLVKREWLHAAVLDTLCCASQFGGVKEMNVNQTFKKF
jgi:hypothetical protein